jgi:hypothetical protein
MFDSERKQFLVWVEQLEVYGGLNNVEWQKSEIASGNSWIKGLFCAASEVSTGNPGYQRV